MSPIALSLPPPLFSPVLKKVIDYPLRNSIPSRTAKTTGFTCEILNISRLSAIFKLVGVLQKDSMKK